MLKYMKKILVVGHTSCAFGGQAEMIKYLFQHKYEAVKFYHVELGISNSSDEHGKISLRKTIMLPIILVKSIYYKYRFQIDYLYYPPASPSLIPFYKDAFLLIILRKVFRKIILHFHASGISNLYPNLNFFNKFLFRKTYFNLDMGIRLSEFNDVDPKLLNMLSEKIVPNGIPDCFRSMEMETIRKFHKINILFCGLVCESKGISILIEAANILSKKYDNLHFTIMGGYKELGYKKQVELKLAEYSLNKIFSFIGYKQGNDKYMEFLKADIFCFPSFFHIEALPVVLLEALQFKLPIVSTKWRGIQSIVNDNENGFLVDIHDYKAVAEKLELLITNPNKRRDMGEKSREIFLQKFTIEKYWENLESAFLSL